MIEKCDTKVSPNTLYRVDHLPEEVTVSSKLLKNKKIASMVYVGRVKSFQETYERWLGE